MRVLFLILTVRLLVADSANGLKWSPPGTWIRTVQTASYAVPPAPGDSALGQVKVFSLGAGQRGNVEKGLIDHWDGQFPVKQRPPKISTSMAGGLKVTAVDIVGSPIPAAKLVSQGAAIGAGIRMLGAIVEGPRGAVVFQFTGPVKTVAAQEAAFQGMIKTIAKE